MDNITKKKAKVVSIDKIYNKINNHIYLTDKDIKFIVYYFTKGKVSTKIIDKTDIKLSYVHRLKQIEVLKNYRIDQLKYLIEYSRVSLKKYNESKKSNFLVDLYNLYTLCMVLHEIEHYNQDEIISLKRNDAHSILLRFSSRSILKNYNNYLKDHDLYYHEYNAVINALLETFEIIEKCDDLNKNAVIMFNAMVSGLLYHSYGNPYRDDNVSSIYDSFNSPVEYTIYLSKKYNEEINSELLNTIEAYDLKEYDKLLNGLKLSDESINLLEDVYYERIKTTNVLKMIKRIDKNKGI